MAVVIPNDAETENKKVNRNIILYCKKGVDENDFVKTKKGKMSRKKKFINEIDGLYDPTQYVVMAPEGCYGWSPETFLTNKGKEALDIKITNNKETSESLSSSIEYEIEKRKVKNDKITISSSSSSTLESQEQLTKSLFEDSESKQTVKNVTFESYRTVRHS